MISDAKYSLLHTTSAEPNEALDYAKLDQDGYVLIHGWLTAPEVEQYRHLVDSLGTQIAICTRSGVPYANRQLLDRVPKLMVLTNSERMRKLVEPVVGPSPFVARSIFFDKSESANWMVTWHQDTTIAVNGEFPVPGYGPWSVKDDVVHVRPPAHVLESMVTVRVHLDSTPSTNGALLVIPGSHRFGILSTDDIARKRECESSVTCELEAGGVMLMRPLLMHASRRATRASRRRVLHFEFAAEALDTPLQWACQT